MSGGAIETSANRETRVSAHHIRSLDGLRGVAFLAVFFFHYGVSAHATTPWVLFTKQITAGGWAGVDLFFVLSGFLITGILLDTRNDPHYFRNFYVRRALRIFPVFYGVALLLLLLTPFLHLQWRLGHLPFLFYFGNIAMQVDPSLGEVPPYVRIVHTWSLAVEEQFYLVWPLVVFYLRDSKRLISLCIAGIVGSLLVRLLFLHIAPQAGWEWSYMNLPSHCDGLLCGAMVAILTRQLPLQSLLRHVKAVFLASLAGLAVIIHHNGYAGYHNNWFTIAGFPLLAAFCTCILLWTIQPGTSLCRLGQTRILRFFGKYSYGMYIYHNLFFPLVARWLSVMQRRLHSPSLGGAAYVLIALAATTVVSVLSFELFEKKWLSLKSRFPYREPDPPSPKTVPPPSPNPLIQ